MEGEVLRLARVDEPEVGRWRELAQRAAEPNPFFEPELLLAAARHLSPEEDPHLLVACEGGEWRACIPVATKPWHRIRVPSLASWMHVYSFLGTPLVDRGSVEPALAALQRAGSSLPGGALLALTDVATDGPVRHALTNLEERPCVVDGTYERAMLRRRAQNDYLASMRGHHRREYQRQRRKLGETCGGEVKTVDRSGDPGAIEEFLAIERVGWKGRHGTAMGSSSGDATFFREACLGFAGQDRLEMLELRAGDRTLAMKCNVLAGDGVFCFKITYDEEFARFSPGVQLELANIDLFHEGSASFMDSCAQPDNRMINRLWPDRRSIVNLLLPSPDVRGRAAHLGVRAVHALRGLRSGKEASPHS